ncbi:MAG: O-antigen ligase family protein [Proteobacteria bacterium]|nr:O-antigen ligase family protein [Pseudomonadota bacterium]MBU2456101.1 O-antigen ligase family protein [Pseudomonadota bacterium]MBU2628766.1 O-antigen ligase family protein [Pseudomonadota bacterium]
MDMQVLVLVCFAIFISFFAQSKINAVNTIIQMLSCVCGFFVFVSMAKDRVLQIRLVWWVAFITLILCIYGLLIHFEIYLSPGWEFLHRLQKGNLCATFANHNHLAGWLEMTILVFSSLLFIKKDSVPVSLIKISVLAVMVTTLIFSLSRGGWAATIAGATFILFVAVFNHSFKASKKLLPVTAVIVFLVFLGIMGSASVINRGMTIVEKQEDVIPARTAVWKETVRMIKTFPLTGIGPGNYPTIIPQFQPPGLKGIFYEAHNDYLQFTAEMGLLFIPLLIWLVVSFFKAGFKKLNHPSRQTRWLTLGAMGGIVAILVHSASDFNLQFPSNALLFTLLAAQVAAPAPELKKTKFEG